MQQRALTLGDLVVHHVFCTYFAVTLDLGGSEKVCSSINNHAVACIFFIIFNWGKVKYKKFIDGLEVEDEIVVSDCESGLSLEVH